MSLKTENKRIVVKRSTVSGVVPTIPSSAATDVYDHTAGGWLATDLYVGEFFMNTADDKLWFRSDNGINLLGYSGMTSQFIDLTDTPSSYTSSAGMFVAVNSGATGLEFKSVTDTDTFGNLLDTPNSYVGYSGYSVVVNASETGLIFSQIQNTLLDLNDIDSTGYTSTNEILMVNSGLTGMELVDGRNVYVDLSTNQNIDGEKYFIDKTTFDDIRINQSLVFTGINETVTINNISTDGSFTASTNNEIPTSYAVKQYVDSQLFGSASTTSFVTIDTVQTITAQKTFNDDVNFNGNVDADSLEVQNDISLYGNQYNDMGSYFYFGNASTNGSYRLRIDTSGNLLIEKRESGTWNMKASF